MATLLNIFKNKNGIAQRLLAKPPPIVVYCFHDHCGNKYGNFFPKSKQNDIFGNS
jgi:hypothetical protein